MVHHRGPRRRGVREASSVQRSGPRSSLDDVILLMDGTVTVTHALRAALSNPA